MAFRVIPTILYKRDGLYKGIRFNNHKYVGDPHNTIRIFSEKEVDELILLDIDATRLAKTPDIDFIQRVAEECYMPFAIGGGINSIKVIRDVLKAGAEKVIINTAAILNPNLVFEASKEFGSTSIVVSIDYKTNLFGKNIIYTHSGTNKSKLDLFNIAKIMEDNGAGEIILTSISREGTGAGLDKAILKKISSMLSIPVVGSGGLGTTSHIVEARDDIGLSAVGVGSYFTFQGSNRSVLITYKKEWER